MARRPERSERGALRLDPRLVIGIVLVAGSTTGVWALVSGLDDTRRGLRRARHGDARHPHRRRRPRGRVGAPRRDAPTATSSPGDVPDGGLVVTRTVEAGELVPDSAVDEVDRTGLASRRRAQPRCRCRAASARARRSTCGRRASSSAARSNRRPCWSRTPRSPASGSPRAWSSPAGASVELLIPREKVAALLEALAAGDAIDLVPARASGRLMARLALALDPATEDRLLADVVEHGHTIVARLVGWRDVLESLDVLAPDVVLVGAGRATLSAELLAACDDRGIRLIALAAGDAERAHAAQLGLHEVLDRSRARGPRSTRSSAAECPCRRGSATREPAARRARSGHRGVGAGRGARPHHARRQPRRRDRGGRALGRARRRRPVRRRDRARRSGCSTRRPGFASACRLAGGDALDRAELERIAQRYSAPRASFDVFTGLVGPSRWPELSRERVTAAIRAMRRSRRVRRRSTPASASSATRSSRATSSRRAATRRRSPPSPRPTASSRSASPTPSGCRACCAATASSSTSSSPNASTSIVNRVRTSALGIDAHAQVRQTLRRFAGHRRRDPAAARRQGDGCRDPHGAHAARRRAAIARCARRSASTRSTGSCPCRSRRGGAARVRDPAAAAS